jgi:hypothetical protein
MAVMFEQGDLLFLDLRERYLSEAIADVTLRQFGVTGPRLSHVGMVFERAGRSLVFESLENVAATPLEEFLARAKPESRNTRGWHWGTLRPPWRPLIPRALELLLSKLGSAYDLSFRGNGESYYCSRLLAEALRDANGGKEVFEYRPMYFGDPNDPNDASWKIWTEHFRSRGETVPVGKPGISPLGIYLSDRIERLR